MKMLSDAVQPFSTNLWLTLLLCVLLGSVVRELVGRKHRRAAQAGHGAGARADLARAPGSSKSPPAVRPRWHEVAGSVVWRYADATYTACMEMLTTDVEWRDAPSAAKRVLTAHTVHTWQCIHGSAHTSAARRAQRQL
jgi:hypothetical protein